MSPPQQPRAVNPTHLRNQFARRFVSALNNLNNPKQSAHDNQMHRRSRRIKSAAYTAMASVVGSRRAWSSAVLWKIRNRSRNQGLSRKNRKQVDSKITTDHHHHHAKLPKREDACSDTFSCSGHQEAKLRKLVPGAENMDSWCLVDETADYIKCLAAQVEVMKILVDLYTAT